MAGGLPKPVSPWNVANQLTFSRLILCVVLFVLIEFHFWAASIVVFAVIAVTDWLDGLVARKFGLSTALGRMLDPLADKIVNAGAFILLLTKDDTGLEAWMVVVIVSREFLITGLRSFMEQQGVSFGADIWGKLKTTLQFAAIFAIFLTLSLDGAGQGTPWLVYLRDGLIWGTVAATAFSGLNYCVKAVKALAWKAYRA